MRIEDKFKGTMNGKHYSILLYVPSQAKALAEDIHRVHHISQVNTHFKRFVCRTRLNSISRTSRGDLL
jgi:hypothetical protein